MNQTSSNAATYNTTSVNSKENDYPIVNSSIKYGLIAGGLIAIFYFGIQTLGMSNSIGLKYAGYGLLGIILAFGLGDYERFLKTGTTFKSGMPFAASIVLFSGLTVVVINVVTFLSGSHLVFSKYGIESTNFPTLVTISGAIFLEIIVAGMIFTFIILQYLKSRKDFKG